MNLKQAQAVIEALLFVTTNPLSKNDLARIVNLSATEVGYCLETLTKSCQSEERGLQLLELAGGYQFATKQQYASYIDALIGQPHKTNLSTAALETLAIVAFKQPITRAEIESIRGVRVERSLQTLLEKGLIEEAGRKETIGRPILYNVSQDFLKYFGLFSIQELTDKDK